LRITFLGLGHAAQPKPFQVAKVAGAFRRESVAGEQRRVQVVSGRLDILMPRVNREKIDV